MTPSLHLTVGLPGAGKTTLARRLAATHRAVRLTPDEWMRPLFGAVQPPGKRDVLEGRLLWTAHSVLLAGASVVLDFGCWTPEERYAVRAVAEHAGASFALHHVTLDEPTRRARTAARWASDPDSTWEFTDADHEAHVAAYEPPTEAESPDRPLPPPPAGNVSWLTWAAARWPSLPDLGQSV